MERDCPNLSVRRSRGSPGQRPSDIARTWRPWVALGFLLLGVISGTATHANQDRFTGRINSIAPSDGVVVIDRSSTRDVEHLVAVDFRGAQVVRVWRDSENPETCRETVDLVERVASRNLRDCRRLGWAYGASPSKPNRDPKDRCCPAAARRGAEVDASPGDRSRTGVRVSPMRHPIAPRKTVLPASCWLPLPNKGIPHDQPGLCPS